MAVIDESASNLNQCLSAASALEGLWGKRRQREWGNRGSGFRIRRGRRAGNRSRICSLWISVGHFNGARPGRAASQR